MIRNPTEDQASQRLVGRQSTVAQTAALARPLRLNEKPQKET